MFIPEKFNSFSDNDLLYLAQQGNYDALLTLLTKYIPLVKSRCSFYVQNSSEFEDYFQEGMVGLLNAIRSFKKDSGAFSAFAKTCVDHILLSHLRSSQKKSAIPAEKTVPLDSYSETPSTEADPQDIILAKEAVQNRKDALITQLSKREYEILTHFLNGESYSVIATALGVSEKSVDNAIQRIRQKLKKQ